uniref:hypothetical protein n=1 Tax=Aliarcobacter sp. TaxID=2321116 RepID=UPI004048B0FD
MFTKIKIKTYLLVLVSLVLFSGCGTVAIYNSQNNLIPAEKQLSEEKVFEAIKIGALSRAWIPKKIDDGLVEAKINVRNKHFAVVHIRYNSSTYSINYVSSENLKSDGETIHNKYNSWVINLKNAIDYQLLNMEEDTSTVSENTTSKDETPAEERLEKKEFNSTEGTWR